MASNNFKSPGGSSGSLRTRIASIRGTPVQDNVPAPPPDKNRESLFNRSLRASEARGIDPRAEKNRVGGAITRRFEPYSWMQGAIQKGLPPNKAQALRRAYSRKAMGRRMPKMFDRMMERRLGMEQAEQAEEGRRGKALYGGTGVDPTLPADERARAYLARRED